MKYFLLILGLILFEYLYIYLADRFKIYDAPNTRSSHTLSVVRGGGIIIWLSALVYFILNFSSYTFFFIGISLVAIISFADDLYKLHQTPRFIAHIAALTLVFIMPENSTLSIFQILPWIKIIALYILYIGILNAFNFMDGINGITGLYSLIVLLGLQVINLTVIPFVQPDFIWFPMIACVVFLLFNFRKRALCFAGDVGAITIGFWIGYLLLILMLKTDSLVWLLLLSVYGVDSVLTIIHRIFLKQNIFEAHRLHFYQVLANEKGIDHRLISAGYALVQLVSIAIIILTHNRISLPILFIIIIMPLIFIYLLKFRYLYRR